MNDVTDPIALGRLNVPKAGDVLADQLRARIRSGELREGQSLPTERELVQQTGLSRMSVREGLRILEAEGLIETRPGRNGGSHVRRPAGQALARHLDLFIWGRNACLEDLHDVREALEALAAEGAARRRTASDLQELTEKTAVLEASIHAADTYLAANLDWHISTSVSRLVAQLWPSLIWLFFLLLRTPEELVEVAPAPVPVQARRAAKRSR